MWVSRAELLECLRFLRRLRVSVAPLFSHYLAPLCSMRRCHIKFLHMDLTRSRMLVYFWATRHLLALRRMGSSVHVFYFTSSTTRWHTHRRLLPSSQVNTALSAAHWALPARMWLSRVALSNEGYTSIIARESS